MCDNIEYGYRENAKPKKTSGMKNNDAWFIIMAVVIVPVLFMFAWFASPTKVDRNVKPQCLDTVYFKVDKTLSCSDSRQKLELGQSNWETVIICRCHKSN